MEDLLKSLAPALVVKIKITFLKSAVFTVVVRQCAMIHYLKKDVVNIRMSFSISSKKQNGMRMLADFFSQ